MLLTFSILYRSADHTAGQPVDEIKYLVLEDLSRKQNLRSSTPQALCAMKERKNNSWPVLYGDFAALSLRFKM